MKITLLAVVILAVGMGIALGFVLGSSVFEAPVVEVPDGGGAPPVDGGSSSTAMILLVGGSLAVAGLAMIALPRLRLRPSLAVAVSSPQRDHRGGSGTRRVRSSTSLGLTLVGLCAVAMFLILRRRA